MQDVRARYGDLVRFECRSIFLWKEQRPYFIAAFGPEYNRMIYTETDRFHSRPFVLPGPRGSAQRNLRQSIFSLNGAAHHDLRHHLLPPFQRSSLAAYYPQVVRLIRKLTDGWRPGEKRNLHRDMHLLIWSIIRELLYGLKESVASEALHHDMEEWMFQTFSPRVRSFPLNLPFTPYRRMLRQAERLEARFKEIINDKRAAGGTHPDALSALLRASQSISEEDLVGHAMTLFLVAYETTGNTLMWTLFLLSQHPEVQQDLLDELAPWRGNVPDMDQLEHLPLLNRVLKESLRILPAVPYSRRLASRDGPMGPYLVPRLSRILFSNYMTHHMPEIYPEPERFLPARWETIRPTPAEYLPFGAGLRTCIGAALAQFIIRIAVALIVPSWKLTVVPGARIDRHLGISLGPRNGIPIIVTPQDRLLRASPISGDIHDIVHFDPPAGLPLRRAA